MNERDVREFGPSVALSDVRRIDSEMPPGPYMVKLKKLILDNFQNTSTVTIETTSNEMAIKIGIQFHNSGIPLEFQSVIDNSEARIMNSATVATPEETADEEVSLDNTIVEVVHSAHCEGVDDMQSRDTSDGKRGNAEFATANESETTTSDANGIIRHISNRIRNYMDG